MTEAHALDSLYEEMVPHCLPALLRTMYTNMAVTIRPSCVWFSALFHCNKLALFKRGISTDASRYSQNDAKKKQETKEWRSVFSYFNSSYNLALNTNSFFNSFDFSPAGIRRSKAENEELRLRTSQAYLPERVRILGGDLAAAHFITYRKGKVRFQGQTKWIAYDEKEKTVPLPNIITPNFVVEALDLSNMPLLYEGLENLKHLEKLEWLSLANCPFIDDWCLDRLAGYFKGSLIHLDISGCQNVTEKGISCLSQFQHLKSLYLGNHPHAQNLELVCLMLEELLPHLRIEGIVYCDKSLLDSSNNKD